MQLEADRIARDVTLGPGWVDEIHFDFSVSANDRSWASDTRITVIAPDGRSQTYVGNSDFGLPSGTGSSGNFNGTLSFGPTEAEGLWRVQLWDSFRDNFGVGDIEYEFGAGSMLSFQQALPGVSLSITWIAPTRGVAMSTITATPTGGDRDYTFSIEPDLPAGLSIDPDTGTISGTPTVVSPSTLYTVTVTDGLGDTGTATLTLEVITLLDLDLSDSVVMLLRGVAMSPITAIPDGGDGALTYTIDPALPAGLMIDPDTGTISGTPTVTSPATGYTVTVTDGGGATATATLTLGVEENVALIVDTFTEVTAAFISNRMDRILSEEPRGYRFDNRRSQGMREVTGRGDDDAMMFRFAGNHVSADNAWHLWTEGAFSAFRHSRDTATPARGHFGMLSLGADYLVNPSLAVGMMAQFDLTSERRRDLSDLSGWGWMAGPYITGEIAPDLFFALRGAVGGSRNNASLDVYRDGSPWFEGDFDTRRALARASIHGVHRFASGLVVSPEVDLAWMRERQRDYLVDNGTTTVLVPGTVAEIGRATLSALIETPLGDAGTIGFVRPAVMWNFHRTGPVQTEALQGAVELGLRLGGGTDWNATGSVRFDGLGSRQRASWSARLNLSRRF